MLQKRCVEKYSILTLQIAFTAIGIWKIIVIILDIGLNHKIIIKNGTRSNIQITIQTHSPEQSLSNLPRILKRNEINRDKSHYALFIKCFSHQFRNALLIEIQQRCLWEYRSNVLKVLSADAIVGAQGGDIAIRFY